MARSRNIKPGFFTNDTLADISPVGRLLFIGLWCHADREGRLNDRPRKIKAEVLPYDECDIDSLLGDLVKAGFILRYEVDGARFIQVLNFTKHQNPHIKEPASEIPEPVEHSESTMQAPDSNSSGPADSLIPQPDSLNRIPDSLPTKAGAVAPVKVARGGYTEEFEQAWALYPRTKDASKRDAFKAWDSRLRAGADPQTMLSGVTRYAAYCSAMQCEQRFIKQPSTFFGPGEHYACEWSPDPGMQRPAVKTIAQSRAETIAAMTGRGPPPTVPEAPRLTGSTIEGEASRVAG